MGLIKNAIIKATIGPEGTFSLAEQVVLNMPQPKLAGKDIEGFLRGRGVTQEEIRELGLDELMSQKSVTREELLDKIQENKVTFEERIFTEAGPEQSVTFTEEAASLNEAYDPEILEGEVEFVRDFNVRESIISDPDPTGFMDDITPEMREWAAGLRAFEDLDSIDQMHLNTVARNIVELNYRERPSTIVRVQADGQEVGGLTLIREGSDGDESFVPNFDSDIDLRRELGFLSPAEIERDRELNIPINPPNFNLTSVEEAAVYLRNFGTQNGYINVGLGGARWAGNNFNLPGGSNYREIRLSIPGAMKFKESVHFPDDQNNVFHVRLKDRVDDLGRNVLFVEEAQSDWAQTIRKPDILSARDLAYEGYSARDLGRPRGLQETMEQSPEAVEQGKQKIQDALEIPGVQEELNAFWKKYGDGADGDIPSWAIDLIDASNPTVDLLKKPVLLAKFLRDYLRQENRNLSFELRDAIVEKTPFTQKYRIALNEVMKANERSFPSLENPYSYPDPSTVKGQNEIDILFGEYIRKRLIRETDNPTRSDTEVPLARLQSMAPPVVSEYNSMIYGGTADSNRLMRDAQAITLIKMREELNKLGLDSAFTNMVSESIESIEPGYVERIRFESAKPQTGPFIRDTQSWNKLMVKRLIRLAEEEGYDGIAFSTGDVQYNRWPRTQDGRDNIGIKQQYDVNIPKAIKQVTKVRPSETTITIPGGYKHTGPFIDLKAETPDGETISEQARRGYTTFSMVGPTAAVGVAALAQPEIAEATEMPITQGIGQLPSQRTGGETEEFDYGTQEPSMLDKAIGAGEVAAEGIMDLLIEPLAGYIGTETAFEMDRSGRVKMTPEQMAAAGDRVRQAIDFEAATPLGREYKENVKAGLGSLGEYLMEPPGQFRETRDPLQILFQEAIDPAAVAVEEGILNLLSLDPRDTEEEEDVRKEAARPVVQAIQPI